MKATLNSSGINSSSGHRSAAAAPKVGLPHSSFHFQRFPPLFPLSTSSNVYVEVTRSADNLSAPSSLFLGFIWAFLWKYRSESK